MVLGTNEDLMSTTVKAVDFNWIYEKPSESFRGAARTRYNMKEQPCTVSIENDYVIVEFDEPQRAITSGQALVIYDGEYVVGGGTIV